MQNLVRQAAENWYGYGTWNAPYWFIGPEPGGHQNPTMYEAWAQLGGGELVDCRAHHQLANQLNHNQHTRWHDERAVLQPTWRCLTLLLKIYEGTAIDKETIREYQRLHWGGLNGREAVVEISCVHAQNMNEENEQLPRRQQRPLLEARIETLRRRIDEHRPTFAVFYGLGIYRGYYEQIVGADFDRQGYAARNGTVCLLSRHPASRGIGNSFWIEQGRELRRRVTLAQR